MPLPIQAPSRRVNLEHLLRGFGSALLLGSIELIIFFPIIVLAQSYLSETPVWLTGMQFLLCYAVGCIGGNTKRLTRTIYELLFSAAVGYTIAFLLQGNNWHGWACAAIGILLVYRGIQYTKAGWLSLFPTSLFLIAGFIYFIAVPIMGRMVVFQMYTNWMNGFGFCTLVIFLFAMHRTQLLNATLASTERAAASSLSETVRRSGHIWLFTLIALIAVIASWPREKANEKKWAQFPNNRERIPFPLLSVDTAGCNWWLYVQQNSDPQ